MLVFLHLRKVATRYFSKINWLTGLMALAIYLTISWYGLRLAGEQKLIGADFFYWIVVTSSTVGYGDLAPSTTAGRWFTLLFVIPVGLSLFALVVGQAATFFANRWRSGLRGFHQVEHVDHTLVIGWNGARTLQLIKLLLREGAYGNCVKDVVLCATDDMENPLPGQVAFVQVPSYTNLEAMTRTNFDKARTIILDNAQDDVTLTTALFCADVNPDAHILAYFQDEKLVPLLKRHCPSVECVPSVSVEMLAKAAADPGSSGLHHQLLDVNTGMTQYSVVYPSDQPARALSAFFNTFKRRYDATIIGVKAPPATSDIMINPPLSATVAPGSVLFYIADERIGSLQWNSFDE